MLSVNPFRKRPRTRPIHTRRVLPGLESLESRTVPYSASGNLWPHPELITLSFVPDGTDLGGQSSNLFSSFNAAFGSSAAWQNAILNAAQTWAQQANINFAVVNDSGASSGSGSYEQGDSNFGDIRIGGFDFGNSNTLALGYLPPQVNNFSIAGDIAFNTAQIFNINGLDYDLYTVALHELGHALGLDHSTSAAAVMYPVYQGVEYGLYPDDVSGVQSIYGAPGPDRYDAAASNNTIGTASDITATIDPAALTAVLPNLDITTTADRDYYSFTAPGGGSGSLALTVQSTGLSLLAPSVRVYNSALKQIASVTGNGYLGSTLSLNVSVTAGQMYYIRVAGANNSAFGAGAYGMTLNFGTGSSPTLSPPDTQTANGDPLNGGGGLADRADARGRAVSELLSGGDPSGDLPYTDLLMIGDGHPETRAAGPVALPPQQGAPETTHPPTQTIRATVLFPPAPLTALPVPTVVEAVTRAALFTGGAAQTDAAATPPPSHRPAQNSHNGAGVALETPLPPSGSAAGIAPASWDAAPEALAPEQPAPAAESEPPTAAPETTSVAARVACFGADWREHTASAILPPHAGGFADEAAEAGEPAALAAVFAFALAPSWGSRSAGADSRRRPVLPC
jgi:hypothetical protein